MIDIQVIPADFEYDICSLVQAFYPAHPFKVNCTISEYYKRLIVKYGEGGILVRLYSHDKKTVEEYGKCDNTDDRKGNGKKESYRRETKNLLKKLLYGVLVKDTGHKLPWGNLTGIRPVKIPEMMLESGYDEEKIRREMKETYFISHEKLELSIDIAKRERRLLSGLNYTEGYSLYVGIPFCPTTCLYCSFTSFPISRYREKADRYVSCLIKEIEYLGEKLKGKTLNTVYIGGGTPTTLSSKQSDRLLSALKSNFDFSTVSEFTVEAGRPDSITGEKLNVLKKYGVSRISINPQTMNDRTLEIIGRKHTANQVREAFAMARECGMKNINMDFILGLPGETEDMVRFSMEEALKMNPEGITIHSLALKRASRLNIQKDKYEQMYMKNSSKLMNIASEYGAKMAMKPYYLYRQKNMAGNQENVGYSKKGREGLYNILMMGDYQNVWAVGAGAVTKIISSDRKRGRRIDTVKDVDMYMDRIDEMIEKKEEYFKSFGC